MAPTSVSKAPVLAAELPSHSPSIKREGVGRISSSWELLTRISFGKFSQLSERWPSPYGTGNSNDFWLFQALFHSALCC